RLANGRDTIALDTIHFAVQSTPSTTTFTSSSPAITIAYKTEGNGYLTAVTGSVAGAAPGAALVVDLPQAMQTSEADTLDDLRHLAYAYKIPLREVTSVPFSKLDTLPRVDTATFQWVSARDKYWIVALMQPIPAGDKTTQSRGIFHGITMRADTAIARIK